MTVGRQVLYASGRQLAREGIVGLQMGEYSEDLFRQLGADTVDSLDASDYEGATLIHDLNDELPRDLNGHFTMVFDGGSIEHIYDVAGALRKLQGLRSEERRLG